MPEETLIEWSAKQPDWARDALRRHAIAPDFDLSEADNDEILGRVRHAAGLLSDPPPECSPLLSTHIKAEKSTGARAILCSLGPVKYMGRLAKEQRLRFAISGITIIYGDNGSGKSSYCRLAKKLCRSLSSEDLLGNVFKAEAEPPTEVLVRFIPDGAKEPISITWVDGVAPPRDTAQIAVFDALNARLYVDQQNRIALVPYEIALLERHGNHRSQLDTAFREEIKAVEKRMKTPLPGGYSVGGAVSKLLARLDPKSTDPLKTNEPLIKAASLTEEETNELAALEIDLINDPSTMAARRRRAKATLESYLLTASSVEVTLSAKAITEYQALIEKATMTTEAAKLAAAAQFATTPLPNVGMSAWRLMYDYAKAYAATISADNDKLPATEGDRCVLCQEPLSSAGAKRIKEFNDFVSDVATKAADDAAVSSGAARKAIQELNIPAGNAVASSLGEYGELSTSRKSVVAIVSAYFGAAYQRRQAVLTGTAKDDFDALPSLEATILPLLTDESALLEVEAQSDAKAAADDSTRLAARARRDQLKDQKKLSDDLPVVIARFNDLEERRKLLSCCSLVETGPVSRQITLQRRSLVMTDLETMILNEIKELGLAHIPFAVSDRSRDGQSYFQVGLNTSKPIPNNRVLSEGEQRAVALACFLAEVGGDKSRNGMIIDDPVSSLDHIRIRRVAARLVKEASTGRQLIIFTHNIVFFNELIEAASQSSPPVPVLRNYIHKSESAGFGIISETDEPWIIQAVSRRITTLRDRLKSFQGLDDFEGDKWRRLAKDFYTDLRETWERLVEEILLGKVVERFTSDVKTQSLKAVVIDDTDYKQVYWAMKRVSERSGHDMAFGKAIPTPTLSDLKADLDAIDQYRITTKQRQNETSARRQALEKPLAANVM
jgi:energy-coupling factor transporter ATP-binding protein EcfA2